MLLYPFLYMQYPNAVAILLHLHSLAMNLWEIRENGEATLLASDVVNALQIQRKYVAINN